LINDLAAEGDTVVVAAAGNVGNSVRQYPAAESDKVLSVAATTAADTLASFSTFGSWVGVAAPGDGLTSTIPGGGYATWSGTSMAAGLVSGEVALVRSRMPRLRARDVLKLVETAAVPMAGGVTRRVDPLQVLGSDPARGLSGDSSSRRSGRH
jgi:subtilisin family serine protease